MVSTIYFDMDGVLSDLDGAVASFFSVTREELRADWAQRNVRHLARIEKLGLYESFIQIGELRTQEMKTLMSDLHSKGYEVEILSSLGVQPIKYHSLEGVTHLTLAAKTDWLWAVYGDLFEAKVIRKINTVPNCALKGSYGRPDALLIDDQEGNVRDFQAQSGKAILYHTQSHEECVAQLWELLK